jgi:cytochrome c peroxidase
MFSSKKILFTLIVIVVITLLSKSFSACKNNSTQESMNKSQIELGRYLFYDRRLSANQTRSCGTCHNPQFAFTDGYKRSLGAFADLHQRNTQALFNLSYLKYFTAADSTIHSPLQQMKKPLFNEHAIEMGAKGHELEILDRIISDNRYLNLFVKAGYKVDWEHIKTAISQFEESLVSFNSPNDKYVAGDSNALSASQKKGKQLFFSASLKCASCHGGKNFSTPNMVQANGDTAYYFNIGLYNIDNNGAYPAYDQGLMEQTKMKGDMGKFRVPTLRNLAYTAPYFHDGSTASLQDVLLHYANGGRVIADGINKGNGKLNPFKHSFIKGFNISEKEKLNLIEFLLSLSDSSFIKNPDYQNPFTEDETKY